VKRTRQGAFGASIAQPLETTNGDRMKKSAIVALAKNTLLLCGFVTAGVVIGRAVMKTV
jgi:hypothetical protein